MSTTALVFFYQKENKTKEKRAEFLKMDPKVRKQLLAESTITLTGHGQSHLQQYSSLNKQHYYKLL